jgi:hypothetical protein
MPLRTPASPRAQCSRRTASNSGSTSRARRIRKWISTGVSTARRFEPNPAPEASARDTSGVEGLPDQAANQYRLSSPEEPGATTGCSATGGRASRCRTCLVST